MRRYVFGIDPKLSGIGIVCFRLKNLKGGRCCCKLIGYDFITIELEGDVSTMQYKYKRVMELVTALKDFIEGILSKDQHSFKITYVIEGYSMRSKGRVFDLAEFGWELKRRLFIDIRKPDIAIVAPQTWKMITLGNGHTKKDLIMKGMYKRFGFDNDSQDINDAFGIGMAFIKMINECPRSQTFLKKWEQNTLCAHGNVYNVRKRRVVYVP